MTDVIFLAWYVVFWHSLSMRPRKYARPMGVTNKTASLGWKAGQ